MPYLNSSKARQAFLFILIIFFSISRIEAQVHDEEHSHDHGHHDHHGHNKHATGMGIAYSSEYETFDPAFHLHAIKGITPYLGLGAGYELIVAEDLHQSISAVISFYPLPLLDISFGAGTVLPTHDESWSFTAHTEFSVTWPIGEHFHMGPLIDIGWSPHGYHLATGIHFGFDL